MKKSERNKSLIFEPPLTNNDNDLTTFSQGFIKFLRNDFLGHLGLKTPINFRAPSCSTVRLVFFVSGKKVEPKETGENNKNVKGEKNKKLYDSQNFLGGV